MPKKVEEVLQELKEKEVEGLILDLRNNSGGLVSSGIAVADSLLSEKPVVETKDRNGIKDAIISQKETSFDGPMVTLVNKVLQVQVKYLLVLYKIMRGQFLWENKLMGKV